MDHTFPSVFILNDSFLVVSKCSKPVTRNIRTHITLKSACIKENFKMRRAKYVPYHSWPFLPNQNRRTANMNQKFLLMKSSRISSLTFKTSHKNQSMKHHIELLNGSVKLSETRIFYNTYSEDNLLSTPLWQCAQ
jgi:hypothetical protein